MSASLPHVFSGHGIAHISCGHLGPVVSYFVPFDPLMAWDPPEREGTVSLEGPGAHLYSGHRIALPGPRSIGANLLLNRLEECTLGPIRFCPLGSLWA